MPSIAFKHLGAHMGHPTRNSLIQAVNSAHKDQVLAAEVLMTGEIIFKAVDALPESGGLSKDRKLHKVTPKMLNKTLALMNSDEIMRGIGWEKLEGGAYHISDSQALTTNSFKAKALSMTQERSRVGSIAKAAKKAAGPEVVGRVRASSRSIAKKRQTTVMKMRRYSMQKKASMLGVLSALSRFVTRHALRVVANWTL